MRRLVAAMPFVLFVAVYLPAAGHGFIRDDSAWILASTSRSLADIGRLFQIDNGFYRPVVSLSFAVNEWMFGAKALGYGITNVLLALACGWAVGALARALGLPKGAAILASALWLLNLHGMRMAVLWISGRTSLLLTLAATLAALALVRGRLVPAALALVAALFAKEEAVLLPIILAAWLLIRRRAGTSGGISLVAWIAVAAAAEALYFAARSMTSAQTPWTAAWYYRPTFDAAALVENALSYADRVGSVPIGVMLLGWIAMGLARPVLTRDARAIIACGLVWTIGGFGLTIFGPVRSDLYAVFPSVGLCVAAAAVLAAMWARASVPAQRRTLAGALVLMLALAPVLVARTRRWSSLAEFSAVILVDLEARTRHLPAGARVVVHDDRSHRNNLGSAFGTIFGEAYELHAGRRLSLWIEPALGDARLAGLERPCDGCVDLELRVDRGRLIGK